MSDLTLTATIETEEPVGEEDVRMALARALNEKFDKFAFNKQDPHRFSCRVKTKLFNPIVSLKGIIQTQIKENRAKVLINASVNVNGWFWITILFSLFFWPLFIVDYWMYATQKNDSYEALRQALNQVEFNLGGGKKEDDF